MISVKNMSYKELKEQIENCRIELDEYIENKGDYNHLSSELHVAEKELKIRKEKLREQIIKDITDPTTMNLEESNYLSYQQFLSDSEMGNEGYEEVIYEYFEEEELVRLWNDSH